MPQAACPPSFRRTTQWLRTAVLALAVLLIAAACSSAPAAAPQPEAAPGVMKTHFPTSDPKVIAEAVRGCRDTGVWIEDVGVDSESLLRWQQVTTRSALIDRPIAYDEIVDSGPAQAASKEG